MGRSFIKYRKTSSTVLEIKLKSFPVLIFFLKRRNKAELEERGGGRGRTEVWRERKRPEENVHKMYPLGSVTYEARQRRSAHG